MAGRCQRPLLIMTIATTPKLDAGTRLAVERTRLAAERTMMAWVRTAASLISFGFTIYKFFQLELKTEPVQVTIGPRGLALIMIGLGLLSLVLAGVQHHHSLKLMKQDYGDLPKSVAGPVAAIVSLLGVLALIAVVVRA
jgi:putative membrane protein